MNEENYAKYFTTRYIADRYPNKFGLQQVFKSFINQRKIRPVTQVRVKFKPYPTSKEISTLIGCYNPIKLKKAFEDYIEDFSYKMDKDKLSLMKEVVVLLNDKIKENEDVSIPRD